jgi:putative Ca2+/H+ antiporter (TMEM165/GDT1 family)
VIDDIFVPLVFIVLSELGDKTQLSILLLSTKTKKYGRLLMGIILAFIIVDGVAILAGEWLADIVPTKIVKIAAAVIFIIVGIFILLFDKKGTKKT